MALFETSGEGRRGDTLLESRGEATLFLGFGGGETNRRGRHLVGVFGVGGTNRR